jgi:peptidoglycan hydrolase-like protein with peptidoglycan-binding domain
MATNDPAPKDAPVEKPTPAQPAKPDRATNRLRVAQAALGVTVTGKLGQPTVEALRAYQSAASLPATGTLDDATWKQLHR